VQQITSLQNPRIQALRALQDKKRRQGSGRFLVEGGKIVEEALAHTVVHTVVVEEGKIEHFAKLLEAFHAANVQVILSPRHVLEALCDTKTPQGIVAEADMPVQRMASGYLVAMDGVQDPGNVGAILRTADAAGFDGALLGPTCADPFGAKALRASMGSVFRVPVLQTEGFADKLAVLREDGYAVLSSQLDGQDFFARGSLPPKLALVIGSEAEGVSAQVSGLATHRLRLPMKGGAESLNAAVAAGVMLYDLARERG